jgi:hypothetical protein
MHTRESHAGGEEEAARDLHSSWDCFLRYWDVYDECLGFNSDGSRDPAQWQGENLTLAAKDA